MQHIQVAGEDQMDLCELLRFFVERVEVGLDSFIQYSAYILGMPVTLYILDTVMGSEEMITGKSRWGSCLQEVRSLGLHLLVRQPLAMLGLE